MANNLQKEADRLVGGVDSGGGGTRRCSRSREALHDHFGQLRRGGGERTKRAEED